MRCLFNHIELLLSASTNLYQKHNISLLNDMQINTLFVMLCIVTVLTVYYHVLTTTIICSHFV